jgi:PAS domain S-box-containing protein
MEEDAVGDIAKLRHQHDERLKELAALHDIARLVRDTSLSVEELLSRVVARVPAAMQFPADCTARIAYGDTVVTTPGFTEGAAVLRRTSETGVIEVAYGSAHPEEHEGPFFAEERALIDSIADIVCAELSRRVAQGVAHDREAELAFAATTADLSLWEWSIDDDRVTWSPELVRLLGFDGSGTTLGANAEAIHPDDREQTIDVARNALADPDRVFDVEFRVRSVGGGLVWVGARGRVLQGTEGRPTRVLAIVADITRRKTLEEGVVHLQKMEAMGQVASGVAHDFNNLLAAATMNLDELRHSFDAADPRAELVSEISEVLERGAALTQQLLAFSRKSELKLAVVHPDLVIRRAEPMLKRLVGMHIQLVLELGATRSVMADPTQLDQIVMNLVVNARDATADGGTITIATHVEEVDSGRVRAFAKAQAGPHVVISVSDTGHGMSEETKARLFEPFFTTKKSGTGLGLAVLFGVVQQSNGFVTVDSAPGNGARFRVYLPATA